MNPPQAPQAHWTVGAYGLIFNDAKEILLVHRRDVDIWQSPGGGVEANENPSEAVVREVKEETGLNISVERLASIYFATKRRVIIVTFGCKITGGRIVVNEEADAIRFFDLENLPNVTPATKRRIKDYLSDPLAVSWAEEVE